MWRIVAALTCVLGGCDGCGNDGSRHILDSPRASADTKTGDSGTIVDASDPNSVLFVAQSPPGPQNGDPATWSGVLQFSISGDFAATVPETGIAKTALEDPSSVAFRSESSELFIGNRHGNNAADGVAGSISRYHYDQGSHALVAATEITGNGLAGVHQIAFSPTSGEMFAANVATGVSRFTFDAGGTVTANGMISDTATRGVFVTPDGKRLLVTAATTAIRVFDLATSAELPATTVSGQGGLHYFAYRLGDVYVAGLYDNAVYRYHLDANDDLVFVQLIAAQAPIGVAFSADGAEMFVSGHLTVDLLQRYTYDAGSDTWMPSGTMDLGSSLGGLALVPG